MKAGHVVLVGRPNSGKSTLLNALIGQKVSITSPKPQTTRSSIEALYEDERGQIIFVDTPGVFERAQNSLVRKINSRAHKHLHAGIDVVVYLIDHTRDRGTEENAVFGMLRKFSVRKILVYNKSDIARPSFLPHYVFLEEEFDAVLHVSALYRKNLNLLFDAIFDVLPVSDRIIAPDTLSTPLLSQNGKQFVAEILREKAFLFLRKEVPYSLSVVVDEIRERGESGLYITARILTRDSRYKKMIVGQEGRMIREIGMAARKELEVATNKKVYIDVTVFVDPHWIDMW